MKRGFLFLALSVVVVAAYGLALPGCGAKETQDSLRLRPYTAADTSAAARAVFPRYVTAEVEDGYQFALAHPDVLRYLPCYCGCGLTAGHTSNLDCFIAGIDTNGAVRFDDHGSFCDTCLQIARDAKRLLGEGKTLSQIRIYVDQTHGEKGPGTDTPWPPQ